MSFKKIIEEDLQQIIKDGKELAKSLDDLTMDFS